MAPRRPSPSRRGAGFFFFFQISPGPGTMARHSPKGSLGWRRQRELARHDRATTRTRSPSSRVRTGGRAGITHGYRGGVARRGRQGTAPPLSEPTCRTGVLRLPHRSGRDGGAIVVAPGVDRYATVAGVLVALILPVIVVLVLVADRQQMNTDEKVRSLTVELTEAISAGDREASIRDTQAQRQQFESRLANALDMAEGEPEVIDVIERSFAEVLDDSPVELLLADNSHAHLSRMAGVGPGANLRAARSTRPTAARRPGGRRCRSSPTATIWTRARSSATDRRGGCRPCACRCPSWAARWASSTPPAHPRRRSTTTKSRPGHPGQAGRRPHRTAPRHGGDPVAGVDGHPHRAAQPPVLLRTAGRGAEPPAPGRRGHGRPRPLQNPERHVRARHGGPGAAPLRPGPARLAPGG